MTATYRTSGKLKHPVNDLRKARVYLTSNDMTQFVQYASHPGLVEVVHHIEWDLTDEAAWQVTVITNRPLDDEESEKLSEWISGQNSDGLGEGFEQQPFAENLEYTRWGDVDEDADCAMSSFDWEDNDCKLTQIS